LARVDTNISIDVELLHKAKWLAAKLNCSLSDLVEKALKRLMENEVNPHLKS